MHVSGKLAFNLNDSFFIGIKNCDFIALELDPDQMLADLINSKIIRSAFVANKKVTNEAGFYERSFAPKEIDNKTLAEFLAQKNNIVNSLLYRTNINTANKEEDTYLDLFMFQAGKKLGKKIIGLETFEGTMDMYAQILKAESELDEKEKNKNNHKAGLYSMEKLEDAYRKGDLVLIDSISKNSMSRMTYKYLVIERNKIMYNGIDSLIKSGSSVFTGVGAAHLGGEEGVLNALRKKGYTVNPVSWKALKPSKLKSQIDKTVVTTQLSKQYSADSSFSAEVPGKIQSLANVGLKDVYLTTDMANGSYYMVSSISHNGFLNKHDKKYWAQKVDSLLYENIDGTITSKKESVTENGDFCFLVNSKTRRSDIERYKIIITPFKIVVFKVAGNSSYANGKEANQFLNSCTLYPRASAHNRETEFTYSFTQNNVFIDNGSEGGDRKHIAVSNDGTKFNMVLAVKNNATTYIEEDTFELNYIIQKAAERNNYKVGQINIHSSKNSAGFEWKKDSEVCKGKLLVSGSHYFLLLDNTGEETFIQSFTLKQQTVNHNYHLHTDTSMLFSVKLVDVPEKNDLPSLTGGSKKKKPAESDFQKEFYTSKATQETISLSYSKSSLYGSDAKLDSMWSYHIDNATELVDPVVTHKVYSSKKGADILDFHVAARDNAHQYIRAKIVQKGRYTYTLTTLCAKDKPSSFVDTFYQTFSLLDSAYGLAATESKIPLLLTNIFHADSATRMDAREEMYILNGYSSHAATIAPENFKMIKEAIHKSAQSDLDMDKRIILIHSLKNIKTTECINWLKTYYTHANDTPAYQFAVLYALAAQQTLPATLAFTELLKKETPIAEENYSFNNCFDQYDDSLELLAKVAPQLVFLLGYDEYKERIIELLAALTYRNLLSTNLYRENKTKFLSSANIELKKHIASLQKNTENSSYNEYDDYDDYEEPYYNAESLTIDTTFIRFKKSILFDYAVLLQPFYDESGVRSFFDKMIKSTEMELQLSVGALLQKNKIPVEEGNWEKWAANATTRTATYKLLHNNGKTEKFPQAYKNLDSIASALVDVYSGKKNVEDSTVIVLKEQHVQSKKGTGTLFVYKRHDTKDNSWKWNYIYLKDDGNFSIQELDSRSFVNKFEEVTDEKILEKIKLSVRVLDRKNCLGVNFYDIARDMADD